MPITAADGRPAATRIYVPDKDILFTDMLYGRQSVNLQRECGDFVLRRADGAWAYQLAVVVDDAMMGVTEVVRGCDLLLSTGQQLYLYKQLGYDAPRYGHIPLLCNEAGQRLSKRDKSLSMAELRVRYSPEEIIGRLAYAIGLIEEYTPCTTEQLKSVFDWSKLPQEREVTVDCSLW
jgi:glutamyl-tRNA synthetase